MKCLFCNKNDSYKILNFGKIPISNNFILKKEIRNQKKFNLIFFLCKSCLLVQVKDTVKYSNIFNSKYLYHSSFSTSWIDHCEKLIQKIVKKFKLKKKSKIIEIASNDGYMLKLFKKKGIDAFGIEPSKSVHKIARKQNLKSINKFFSYNFVKKNKKILKNPDLIIGLNVLAHTPKLKDFITALDYIMGKDSIAIFEIQYLDEMFKNLLFDTIYHEHYSYFSLTSLKKLFTNFDIDIFDFELIKTHGGSIRIYIKKRSEIKKKQENKVNNLLIKEKQIGINKINYYKKFAIRTKKQIINYKNQIIKFSKTKKIYGYGAPAKTTIFCNLTGINKENIELIFDKNPFKNKRFIPGMNIPIVKSSLIKQIKPKNIIIFPRNLKNEIQTQLKFIKKWGGKLYIFKNDLKKI